MVRDPWSLPSPRLRRAGGVRYFLVVCLAALAGLCSGCAKEASSENNVYLVRSVADGDTIELQDGRRVRYIGIDTPETRNKVGGQWVYDPEEYAEDAKKFNESLVGGNKVRLEFDAERKDKYGRDLAFVYTDNGLMANEELVREGYSLVYYLLPNRKHLEGFMEAQRTAMENKAGLWKGIKVITPDEAGKLSWGYCVVRGRVNYSGREGRGSFTIGFDGEKENSLKCIIPARNLPLFKEFGVDPAIDYTGKNVEITGKVKKGGSPVLMIVHPYQIRVL
ncbi:MAG: thermonuclease family protein [Candidatus Omnitrophica bacterium]|nr:thermonuclease family protein [Candidatus Omnitrophota bacterium]